MYCFYEVGYEWTEFIRIFSVFSSKFKFFCPAKILIPILFGDSFLASWKVSRNRVSNVLQSSSLSIHFSANMLHLTFSDKVAHKCQFLVVIYCILLWTINKFFLTFCLIPGTGESGKSTVSKQLKIIHNDHGFTEE